MQPPGPGRPALPDVHHGSASYPVPTPGPVVTVGNFDGVHRGHQALVARAGELAAGRGSRVAAYTFHPAPRDVLRPDNDIPRIQSLSDRIEALARAGVQDVVVEEFTRELAARPARWFAREVLGRRLGASAVVLGWNFHFGRGREGDVEALRGWLDVPVETFGPWCLDGQPVSSSRIRQAVRRGEVEEAARLLGRAHQVVGVVVPGDRRGRELGFPTANVAPRTALLPADGVYAVRVDLGDGEGRDAVANMGQRPTFGPGRRVLEVHLLDFRGDLYGREVRVHLVARLRAERRFADAAALERAIVEDVRTARAVLAGVPGDGDPGTVLV